MGQNVFVNGINRGRFYRKPTKSIIRDIIGDRPPGKPDIYDDGFNHHALVWSMCYNFLESSLSRNQLMILADYLRDKK